MTILILQQSLRPPYIHPNCTSNGHTLGQLGMTCTLKIYTHQNDCNLKKKITCIHKDVEKLQPLCTVVRIFLNATATLEDGLAVFKKVKQIFQPIQLHS